MKTTMRGVCAAAVALALATTAEAQAATKTVGGMFDAQANVIASFDALRCDELPKFDNMSGRSAADWTLGAYGLGYILGGIEQVTSYLDTAPTTPNEQATATALRAKYDGFPLTVNIVMAHMRAHCLAHPDETVVQAIRALLHTMLK